MLTLINCKSPSQRKINEKESLQNDYLPSSSPAIEIYCWCFHNEKMKAGGEIEERGECETLIPLTPKLLINSKFLLFSSSQKRQYDRLKTLFFQGNVSDSLNQPPVNTRFLMLLNNGETRCDTLVFSSNKELIYNNRYLFTYKYNVMDSIRSILKMDAIDCLAN